MKKVYSEAEAVRAQNVSPEDQMAINRLMRWRRQSAASRLLPGERVAKCYRVRVQELVSVMKSLQYKRAHYKGLAVCGSVWNCPVCAAKITERRRVELQAAIDKAAETGLYFFMATFTLQHAKGERLKDLRKTLTEALRKTRSGRWHKNFVRRFGIVGNVTGSEVTYGSEFGWHYHKHVIYFSKRPLSQTQKIQKALYAQYGAKLNELGRYAHPIHGVDVRAADRDVAAYVSKYGHEDADSKKPRWTLAAEITKGASKTGGLKTGEHFTAFQLLDLFLHGEKEAGNLFQEYAEAMKYARQLRWSSGLREILGLGAEITDEEVATMQDDDAVLFAQLTVLQWQKILQLERRGQVLEVASVADVEAFTTYLQSLFRADFQADSSVLEAPPGARLNTLGP